MAPATKNVEKEPEEVETEDADETEDQESADVETNVGVQTKSKRDLKKDQRKKQKEESDAILGELSEVFTFGNRLITKSEKFGDELTLNKKLVMNLQRQIKFELGKFIEQAQKTKAPTPTQPRNKDYGKPVYFRKAFFEWLADPETNLSAKDIKALMNNESLEETVPYDGRPLGKALVATRDYEIEINGKEINVQGLASKAIVNAVLSCYLTTNKLKGLPVEGKDGTKKIVYNLWKPDANMKRHFGPYLKELVTKAKEKDPLVSLDRMALGAIMALLAKLTDTERNNEVGKDTLRDPLLVEIIATDYDLVDAVYNQVRPAHPAK